MGIVAAHIKLSNARDLSLKPVETHCIVDTGATYLCIPHEVALQLKLDELHTREVKLANGRVIAVPYVGPIQLQFEDRVCFGGAMVMGDEILLGAIPMEDMDLIVHPKLLKLSVHPERPNLARGLAM